MPAPTLKGNKTIEVEVKQKVDEKWYKLLR